MTIEDKAQAMVDEVRGEYPLVASFHAVSIALFRAIEQHEAFQQEVSHVVHHYVYASGGPDDWEKLKALIIPAPKPDPLVEAAKMMGYFNTAANAWAGDVRAALDAAGFEIREKGQ